MDGLVVRSFRSEMSVEGDGRTVRGLLAPYNEVAEVDDGFGPYREMFAPGCFARCIRGRATYLQVQLTHGGHWCGRGERWIDTPDGLEGELRLDNTEAGREAGFKIRDGQTPGLSLAFLPGPGRSRMVDGQEVIVRTNVKALHHVALCQTPAYESAQVEAVRSKELVTPERLEYWRAWTERVRRV